MVPATGTHLDTQNEDISFNWDTMIGISNIEKCLKTNAEITTPRDTLCHPEGV